jgi:hypothetical protein
MTPARLRNASAKSSVAKLPHLERLGEAQMRSVFLWLIGVPIPIILLVAFCTHHL